MKHAAMGWLAVNKRALSYEIVMWIPRLVYLIIVIIASFGLIFAYTSTTLNVGDVESHILMHRLQFTQNGIVKQDVLTGRVYPGIVDNALLTDEKLSKLYSSDSQSVAIRFVSTDLREKNSEVAAYVNQESYENWQPIAILVGEESIEKGTGRKFPYRESRYVYTTEPSRLATTVILPDG